MSGCLIATQNAERAKDLPNDEVNPSDPSVGLPFSSSTEALARLVVNRARRIASPTRSEDLGAWNAARSMIYDISPPITDSLAVFPGDTPPVREVLMDMHKGAPLTLSTLRSTVHVGAHADAPSHYGRDAQTIDELPLETFVGPCQVIRVSARHGALLSPDVISPDITEPRALFFTGTYPDPTQFNDDFAALSPELVDWLAERGVKLVGVDTPSVDPATSIDSPAHRWTRTVTETATPAIRASRTPTRVACPARSIPIRTVTEPASCGSSS